MLIATSPRLSSDQEKKKSTEEACPVEVVCVSSKRNSGIFCEKRGNTQTYEEHSWNIPNSLSTFENRTDRITNKHPKELSDSHRTINAQSQVYSNSLKPTVMQVDMQHHTNQPTESQGEEFIYYIQHAETPSAELDSSLKTVVLKDDLCSFLQTATVESEESALKTLTVQSAEPHVSIQMPTVQSEQGNPLQTSTAQSERLTNHLQISTGQSDTFCDSLKTATLESDEPFMSSHVEIVQPETSFKSSQTASVQSEEPFASLFAAIVQSEEPSKSLKTAVVQSEELCSSTRTTAVLSEEALDCLQIETVHSEGPCDSLWTPTDQPEELNRPLLTSTDQSKKLSDSSNTTSLQSVAFYEPKVAETDNGLQQSALDDLYHTGQAAPNHSQVLYQPMQGTTVQADCHHTVKATEDRVDNKVNAGQRSSTQFEEPYYVKQASTVQSEEIYLSRTCDSHWSDRVTANKVAVEGDLNG